MKLNNRGWGDRELIISCCIIFILLLIIVLNVNRLYKSMEESLSVNTTNATKKTNTNNNNTTTKNNNGNSNSTNNDHNNTFDTTTSDGNYDLGEMDLEYYKNSEIRLEDATRKYIINNDLQLNEAGQMIEIATLINSNYIANIRDLNDNSICNAYSFVYMNADNSIIIKPYISCTSYTTEGY